MGYLVNRWIHEAPEDENQAPPAENPEAGADQQDAPAEGNNEDQQDAQDAGDDEDFNIDTSLDDDEGEEGEGEEEAPPQEDQNQESDRGDEPVDANTDIFSSLTSEEQQIKIGELKSLYKDLYNGVNDLLHRIDDMDIDEDILVVVGKISEELHRLKDSIADYFEKVFNMRSYFENDVKYNEFLLVLKKATTIVDDLANIREKRIGLDSTNSKDKNNNI